MNNNRRPVKRHGSKNNTRTKESVKEKDRADEVKGPYEDCIFPRGMNSPDKGATFLCSCANKTSFAFIICQHALCVGVVDAAAGAAAEQQNAAAVNFVNDGVVCYSTTTHEKTRRVRFGFKQVPTPQSCRRILASIKQICLMCATDY